MADNKETIIVGVEFDAEKLAARIQDTAKRMSELRKEAADLKKAIKEQGDADGALAVQLASVQTEIGKVQKEQKGLIATTKQLTDADTTYGDSLNEMRRRLGDLQKAYDNLSAAERESAAGQELQKKLQEQDAAVKQLEQTTGRFQRNVGNYPSAFNNVLPGLNKATAAMQKMGLTMEDLSQGGGAAFSKLGTSVKAFGKTMLTPPVGLIVGILSALMLIIQKLSAAFKKNDDAMTALSKAFAAFQPIATGISKIFDKLANGIGKALSSVADFAVKIGGKISPEFEKAAVSAAKLVVAQDELEDAEREYTVNTAERAKEISRLRNEAASTDDLAKRQRLLREAIALEQQDLEDRKKIADEKLRIAEETARKEVDTSDETKNKIAELKAAQLQAEQAYYDGVRRMEKELTGITAEHTKQREDAARKLAENEKEIAQMAEDFALSLIADETEKAIAERRLRGEREIAELQERLKNEAELTEQAREQLNGLIAAKQTALEAELERIATEAADARTEEEYAREQEHAQELLEYRIQLAEDGSETELEAKKALLDLQMQQALDETTLEEEEKYIIREAFAQKALELDKQYHDNLVKQAEDAKDQYKKSLLSTAKNASKTFGAMTTLLDEYGKDNEKAAAASKAFGIAKIVTDQAISIADTAKAITAAVAGATEAASATGPAAPFVLAGYIAAMVGAVLGAVASVASSIVQARQLIGGADGGNFAEGGFVPGTSYTGDHVNIRTNSAEAVLTPAQQRNFMDLANGGKAAFDYDALASVMAAAVAALPAPVMDYAEFTDFEQRTATYNEIASI